MRHQILKICLAVCFTVLWEMVSSEPQQLVCNTVQGIQAGPRGERGSPGMRGSRGVRGKDVGAFKSRNVDLDIEEKMGLVLGNIRIQIGWELGHDGPTQHQDYGAGCMEDYYYRGRCYSLRRLSTVYEVSYTTSVTACKEHGALLAEIHDQAQQSALEEYLRSMIPTDASVMEVWLGMKFVSANSTLLYRSGKELPSHRLEWSNPRYPSGEEPVSRTAITLNKINRGDEGLVTATLDLRYLQGALCERDF